MTGGLSPFALFAQADLNFETLIALGSAGFGTSEAGGSGPLAARELAAGHKVSSRSAYPRAATYWDVSLARGSTRRGSSSATSCGRPGASLRMTQSRTKSGQIYVGRAAEDARGNRGWLFGHFLPEDDPRHSDDVEIKWGRPPRRRRAPAVGHR